jgi:hypothetical protein
MAWQKTGGVAAFAMAMIYVLGFVVLATALSPSVEASDPASRLAFMLDHQLAFQLWLTALYVLFGVLLVVLQVALQQRLLGASVPALQWTGAMGMIWAGLVIASGMVGCVGLEAAGRLHAVDPAQALLLWTTLSAVQDGLGGGVEVVGGLWMFGVAALIVGSARLPRYLAWLSVPIGGCGVLTVLPPLGDLGAVFGLGQILWFALLGIALWTGRALSRHD